MNTKLRVERGSSRRRGRRRPFWAAGVALLAASCGGQSANGEASAESEQGTYDVLESSMPRDVPQLGEDDSGGALVNEFAWEFYSRLWTTEENRVYSPLSTTVALATLGAAASGVSLEQILGVLGSSSPSELHQDMNGLLQGLAAHGDRSDESTLQFATSSDLWARESLIVSPELLDTLARYYGTGLHLADFSAQPEQSRQEINGKVSTDTAGLIPELLPPGALGASTTAVLTNALYLAARWSAQFSVADTSAESFTTLDGQTVSTEMLKQVVHVPYSAGDDLDVLALPLAHGVMEMVFLVPELGSFEATLQSLDAAYVEQRIDQMSVTHVALQLPKFQIRSALRLKEALQAAGVVDVFGGGASLEKLGGGQVEEVYHQARLSVDEEGVVAAAATGVVVVEVSGSLDEPLDVRIDRPFVFMVRDVETAAVLFLGHVVDPTR